MTSVTLPMFPLETVLFPLAVLPLHVFEERYRRMMSDVADGSPFGVVLIERGTEVGGDDTRFETGTTAVVVRRGELGGGRLAIVAVGQRRRFRVVRWEAEVPYPTAEVEVLGEPELSGSDRERLASAVDQGHRAYRRTMALASELGSRVGRAELALPDDAIDASWFLTDAAPIEQLDRQRLLAQRDHLRRMALLERMLTATADDLAARLAAG